MDIETKVKALRTATLQGRAEGFGPAPPEALVVAYGYYYRLPSDDQYATPRFTPKGWGAFVGRVLCDGKRELDESPRFKTRGEALDWVDQRLTRAGDGVHVKDVSEGAETPAEFQARFGG